MYREKVIKKLIDNKDVLDIGSTGQTDTYSLWSFYDECNPKTLTGIDIEELTNENKLRFNLAKINLDKRIIVGDMETYDFNETFDVIIAGDIIEHVSNQGLFLNNIKKHLRNNGKLIITTPNAKWLTVFLKTNPTHTLWHDKNTLNRILSSNGFMIDKFFYYYGNKSNYSWFLRPLVLRQSILVIAQKRNCSTYE